MSLKDTINQLILELPDWAKDRGLMLLAGQEIVFWWNESDGLRVKSERCNKCGECCCDIPDGYLPFGITGDGKCKKLQPDGTCGAGRMKPFVCLGDPAESEMENLGCSIKYD
jgi:hypothetical protein